MNAARYQPSGVPFVVIADGRIHNYYQSLAQALNVSSKVASERNVDVSVEDMLGNVVQIVKYKKDEK